MLSHLPEPAALLRACVDGVSDALFVKDLEGRYLMINTAGAQYLGKTVAEVLGKDDRELFEAETAERIMEDDRRVARQGAETLELTGAAAGVTRTWLVTKTPYCDEQGAVVGVIGIARDITAQKRADEQLRDYSERVQTLSRRLLTVQEQERRHLARELHDEIGQALSLIALNLKSLQENGGGQRSSGPQLEQTLKIVDETIEQVRKLSLDLRPSMLDDLGLISTLHWYIERQSQRTGIAVHFDAQPSGADLVPEVETTCYRVVQEAFTNVLRHARAKNVWISCRDDGEQLQLSIIDDGKGFDIAAVQNSASRGASFGLFAMRERIALLDGQFSIDSAAGRGTTIAIRLRLTTGHPSQPGQPEYE